MKARFTLYIAGPDGYSRRAIDNLEKIVGLYLEDQVEIQVVDIRQNRQAAWDARIIATPTLVKELPPPSCRVAGDLSDQERVLLALGLPDLVSNQHGG